MNSFYSNLIEGHSTRPADIAHIEVQRLLEAKLREEPRLEICSREFLCWIHAEFYRRMPEEFRVMKDRQGNELRVQPGQLRDREVEVGAHLPPAAGALPAFLERFAEAYDPPRLGEWQRLVAAAASHHRLAWIHPFLDGNGRVARLFSHAYLIRAGADGHGLWAMSRGLARRREEYLAALRSADQPRRGELDGRGNLSREGLVGFVAFFLETALDQINFMSGLLDLESLEKRLQGYVERSSSARELSPEAFFLLREALGRGEFARGEAARLTGKPERTARIVLKRLLDRGLLVSSTPKGPVRLGLPLEAVGYYFPRLYPEGSV